MIRKIVNDFSKILIFFVIFNIVFSLTRNFFENGILFYQGILTAFVTLIIFIIFYLLKKIKIDYNLLIASFFICYSYLITIPALLDRSISLYFLTLLDKKGTLTLNEIDQYFINDFVYNKGSSKKRLDEQQFSGNIRLENELYKINDNGRRINKLNGFLSKIYKTDQKYLKVEVD